MKKKILQNLGSIIGHRGVAALAPENTIESFALAHHYGLQSVEFDVTLSADGEAFVFHDETLERTTNGQGQFGLASSEYLRSLDAGSWFSPKFKNTRIPSLRETLIWLRDHQMSANIEIKPFPGFVQETVKTVLTQIDELWPSTQPLPLISSFENEVLQLCHSLQPQMPLGYLMDRWRPEELALAQSLDCVSMNLNHRMATAERIQILKSQGFSVFLYTVNYQSLISKYFSYGIDGVFSDYPQWRIQG